MTKRRALAIFSFLLVMLAATSLCAQACDPAGPMPAPWPAPPPPPPCAPPGPHMPGVAGMHHPIWSAFASVGLDEKQQRALDAIKINVAKSLIRKTAEARIARIDLREALSGENVDMKAVEQKVQAVALLHAEMELAVIRGIEEAKALLTAQQKTRLKELRRAHDMPGSPHGCLPAKSGKNDRPATRAEKG